MKKHEDVKVSGSNNIVDDEAVLLARDAEALFERYKPLRIALYNEFKGYLPNHASMEDLISFINEQFTRLCYEYDPSGDVDFAGYIKIMLKMRVRYSFVGKEYKVREKEPLGTEEDIGDSIANLQETVSDASSVQLEFFDYIVSSANLSPLDIDIIKMIINGASNTHIEVELYKAYRTQHVSKSEIKRQVKEVREFLQRNVEEWVSRSN